MSQVDTIHPDTLELAELLRPSWPELREDLRRHPILVCDGDGDGDGGGDGGGSDGDGDGAGAGGTGGSGGDGDGAGGSDGDQTPPWGSDDKFDPQRAWKLITGIRSDLDKVKTDRDGARAELKKRDDATKSDQEKLEERATDAEDRATKAGAEAARLRVALRKGLSETQAKRLVGETEEDLEKDADELLADFKSEDDDDGETPRRRPKERMRTGAARRQTPDESDPAKLADAVPRGY